MSMPVASAQSYRPLLDSERQALDDVGLGEGPEVLALAKKARRESAAAFNSVFESALTLAESSELLGSSLSAIQQRLDDGTLLKITTGTEIFLPAVQFHDGAELPGLRELLVALPKGMSAMAILSWLGTPSVDLAPVEDDGRFKAISPRDYLIHAGSVSAVVKLASRARAV
eukprot:TRINITY_DN64933_c0_g1_i4.p1 TRINITY_DN64933_c0_g1~~TRINITY_DN64933_c0_g1_i4.p1  ORF type:complete len:171 (+),score=28.65 TRINITY_DN64933_c0_g1_i4:226-738(+)